MNNRIILPLDNLSVEESIEIMELTQGLVWGYKLRRQIVLEGIEFVSKAKKFGNIMLDFKLYDIPSAMTESLALHFLAGADISTIHCTSCFVPPSNGTGIAGVTILTSFLQGDFEDTYNQKDIDDLVERMTEKASLRKYEYLVCSPLSLPVIKHINIKKICPGIRPHWYSEDDDQLRVSSPKYAIQNGADLLVIGRPILNQPSPEKIVESINKTNDEIEKALNMPQ